MQFNWGRGRKLEQVICIKWKLKSTNVSSYFTWNRWYWSTAMSALLKSTILPIISMQSQKSETTHQLKLSLSVLILVTYTFINICICHQTLSLPGILEKVSHMLSPLFPSSTAPSNYDIQDYLIVSFSFWLSLFQLTDWIVEGKLVCIPGKPKKQFQR